MTALVFVDTNVLVYAHDLDAGDKRVEAANRLEKLWQTEAGVLSIQVLQEFFATVTRKISRPLPIAQAREIMRLYRVWIRRETTVDTVLRATELMELSRLSFWDSLVVAAAEENGCGELLSEDLNAGQVVAGVKIVDPFK